MRSIQRLAGFGSPDRRIGGCGGVHEDHLKKATTILCNYPPEIHIHLIYVFDIFLSYVFKVVNFRFAYFHTLASGSFLGD